MKYNLCFLLLFLILPVSAQNVLSEELESAIGHFEKLNMLFRSCADKTLPCVVNVRVIQNQPSGQGRNSRAAKTVIEESGTGFVAEINGKRIILTNRHVIGDAEQSAVEILTLDRRTLTPVKISSNEDFDLAVIEVSEPLPQPIVFGDSRCVCIGDIVLAAGNPFGLDQSLSMGIISGIGRRQIPGTSGTIPRIGFFQTDAAVNPGSSGGILLNLRGEAIGILTAIATQSGGNEGIAFAMPVNDILPFAEQLVKNGTIIKPFIGFGFDASFSADERKKRGIDRRIGAKIKNVTLNSPAEQAGLKTGDIVLAFNGTEVEDDLHITHLVAQSAVKQAAVLKINRDGKISEITVVPAAQLSR